MMNYPPVNELEDILGCRYLVVTAVAKRARQLISNPEELGDMKPVSAAVDDLYKGRISVNIKHDEDFVAVHIE
ncbi:MAG: DNA-directed RNA polymerase subunit omega [Clostridia bacterium]